MPYSLVAALPFIVGIVASSHYLVGDGKTLGEGVFKDIAFLFSICRRIYVHVTTVASAAECADGTVGKICSILTSVPQQLSLYVHLYRLEVEVEEMWIDKRTLIVLGREVERADSLVGRVVEPVDGLSEVEVSVRPGDVAVELAEVCHEGIVLTRREESIAVASHEYPADFHMATYIKADRTNHVCSRTRRRIYLKHGGGVAASIDIALY